MSAAAFRVRGLLLTVDNTPFPVETFTMDVEVLSSAVIETALATLQAELDRRRAAAMKGKPHGNPLLSKA